MPRKQVSEKDIILSTPVSRRKPAASKRAKRSAPEAEASPVVAAAPEAPSQEQIARLAYLYWEARGCQGGTPEEDWLRAEQELTAQVSLTATA